MKKSSIFFATVLVSIAMLISCQKESTSSYEGVENDFFNKLGLSTERAFSARHPTIISMGKDETLCANPPCPCGGLIGNCGGDAWSLVGVEEVKPWHIKAEASINGDKLHLVFQTLPSSNTVNISGNSLLPNSITNKLGYDKLMMQPGTYLIDFSGNREGEVLIDLL